MPFALSIHRLTSYLLLFSFFSVLSACGPDLIYDATRDVSRDGWAYDNPLHFTFQVQDTNKVYNLWMEVVHSTDFKNQNIYTKLYTSFPDGQKIGEVVSLELADRAGAWHGACGSSVCKVQIPLQTETYFNQIGEYALTVEQYMRKDSVKGILALRFMIEDIDKIKR